METSLKANHAKGRKIYFFGHFGSANFGNEITFQTMLYHARQRLPGSEFACICTNPQILRATQKIEANPISRDFAGSKKSRSSFVRLLRKFFIGVPRELIQWWQAFKILNGADMLIVPGTGLLTDAYGLQGWGPYNLFKWSVIAKLRGSKLLFLSVGAGPLYTALGRFFVKAALFMADFRSYRDGASMNYLKGIGFRSSRDRVYPDLVFSMSEKSLPYYENIARPRRVVGIGLMVYAGKYSVATPHDAIFQKYLESLVIFTQWLLEHDYDIKLLIGEADDWPVLEEFKSLLKATVGVYDEKRVTAEPSRSVEQLLPHIAAADIIVATRFHNIVLALVLKKPVVAISFHHKCSSLMKDLGFADWCHDINHMDPARLIAQFVDLENKAAQLKPAIREKVEQSRRALDEQYDVIFKNIGIKLQTNAARPESSALILQGPSQ